MLSATTCRQLLLIEEANLDRLRLVLYQASKPELIIIIVPSLMFASLSSAASFIANFNNDCLRR